MVANYYEELEITRSNNREDELAQLRKNEEKWRNKIQHARFRDLSEELKIHRQVNDLLPEAFKIFGDTTGQRYNEYQVNLHGLHMPNIAPISPVQLSPVDTDEVYIRDVKRAESLFESGDFRSALKIAEELRIKHGTPKAYELSVKCLYKLNDYKGVLDQAWTVIRDDRASHDVYWCFAAACKLLGSTKYEEAESAFEYMLRRHDYDNINAMHLVVEFYLDQFQGIYVRKAEPYLRELLNQSIIPQRVAVWDIKWEFLQSSYSLANIVIKAAEHLRRDDELGDKFSQLFDEFVTEHSKDMKKFMVAIEQFAKSEVATSEDNIVCCKKIPTWDILYTLCVAKNLAPEAQKSTWFDVTNRHSQQVRSKATYEYIKFNAKALVKELPSYKNCISQDIRILSMNNANDYAGVCEVFTALNAFNVDDPQLEEMIAENEMVFNTVSVKKHVKSLKFKHNIVWLLLAFIGIPVFLEFFPLLAEVFSERPESTIATFHQYLPLIIVAFYVYTFLFLILENTVLLSRVVKMPIIIFKSLHQPGGGIVGSLFLVSLLFSALSIGIFTIPFFVLRSMFVSEDMGARIFYETFSPIYALYDIAYSFVSLQFIVFGIFAVILVILWCLLIIKKSMAMSVYLMAKNTLKEGMRPKILFWIRY